MFLELCVKHQSIIQVVSLFFLKNFVAISKSKLNGTARLKSGVLGREKLNAVGGGFTNYLTQKSWNKAGRLKADNLSLHSTRYKWLQAREDVVCYYWMRCCQTVLSYKINMSQLNNWCININTLVDFKNIKKYHENQREKLIITMYV